MFSSNAFSFTPCKKIEIICVMLFSVTHFTALLSVYMELKEIRMSVYISTMDSSDHIQLHTGEEESRTSQI